MVKTHVKLIDLHKQFKGRCYYCYCRTWLPNCPEYIRYSDQQATREHLIRVADGGTNHATNIVLACRICNESRKDVPHDEWLKIRSKLREEV